DGDAGVEEEGAEGGEVVERLGRAVPLPRGHDLYEGDAAAVVVHAALLPRPGMSLVQELARVLLHVDPLHGDGPEGAAAGRDLDGAAGGERPLVLRDLVALGQVGIEVVLAR